MCFTIALHAFSHLRHSSAHAFMCLSSGNASHALAHWSHDFTQDSQIRTECGPPLETICAAAAQTVAQSKAEFANVHGTCLSLKNVISTPTTEIVISTQVTGIAEKKPT